MKYLPIKGYEGRYEINNHGQVKSLPKYNFKEKILTPWVANKIYHQVKLVKDGVEKVFYVHRLVAQTLIPNPGNKPCVNHIDNNGLNNHISNLEWVTRKENTQHMKNQNRGNNPRGENHWAVKLKRKDITKIRESNLSYSEISSNYGVSTATISDIKVYKSWKHIP